MFVDDVEDLRFLRDEIFNKNIDPWDKIVLVYLAYLGYQNFQIACQSYQCIKMSPVDIPFYQQCLLYFLLFYTLNNVHISYKYFLYKVYMINHELARRMYHKFNKYFDYFSPTPEKTKNRYEESESDESEEENEDWLEEIHEMKNDLFQTSNEIKEDEYD